MFLIYTWSRWLPSLPVNIIPFSYSWVNSGSKKYAHYVLLEVASNYDLVIWVLLDNSFSRLTKICAHF